MIGQVLDLHRPGHHAVTAARGRALVLVLPVVSGDHVPRARRRVPAQHDPAGRHVGHLDRQVDPVVTLGERRRGRDRRVDVVGRDREVLADGLPFIRRSGRWWSRARPRRRRHQAPECSRIASPQRSRRRRWHRDDGRPGIKRVILPITEASRTWGALLSSFMAGSSHLLWSASVTVEVGWYACRFGVRAVNALPSWMTRHRSRAMAGPQEVCLIRVALS